MRWKGSEPDEENPEWTDETFRRARPIAEVAPEIAAALRRYQGQRGPQKAPTKVQVSLRLDRDVIEALRATGRGWQTRVNAALRAHVTKRRATRSIASTPRRQTRRTV